MNEYDRKRQRLDSLGTWSQGWASQQRACLRGRGQLGKRSVAEFWNDPLTNVWDLYWIGTHLKPADETQQAHYERGLWTAFSKMNAVGGRWRVKHMRQALLAVFHIYNVSFPAELL